jgi:hypothetical protein
MPRSLQVLRDISVCQDATAIRDPKVVTRDDFKSAEHTDCPLFERCNSGTLLGPNLRNCIPRMGQDVARYAAEAHRPVERELDDFRHAPVFSKMGFIDPYADADPDHTIKDKAEIVTKVGEWAKVFAGGETDNVRDERCICPVLRPTPGGCPVHGG